MSCPRSHRWPSLAVPVQGVSATPQPPCGLEGAPAPQKINRVRANWYNLSQFCSGTICEDVANLCFFDIENISGDVAIILTARETSQKEELTPYHFRTPHNTIRKSDFDIFICLGVVYYKL